MAFEVQKLRSAKWAGWLGQLSHEYLAGTKAKRTAELSYWHFKRLKEGTFNNNHFEYFFTDYFGLRKEFYNNKKILDIGCGPRGSLEWADNCKERVGLDPLAKAYQKMSKAKHDMSYVEANSEDIPFEDNYFDVLSSFNSLDHVENLQSSISEITRVLKPGGLFLLITDVHEKPTITEPSGFGWEIMDLLKLDYEVLSEEHYEGNLMYKSIREAVSFDHDNPKDRYGILTTKLWKIAKEETMPIKEV